MDWNCRGDYLVTGCYDGVARVWNTKGGVLSLPPSEKLWFSHDFFTVAESFHQEIPNQKSKFRRVGEHAQRAQGPDLCVKVAQQRKLGALGRS